MYTKCIINVLKEVFAVKRNNCDDIINQAEKIIADYISRRRNEIIDKYAKKKTQNTQSGAYCNGNGSAVLFVSSDKIAPVRLKNRTI